MTEELIRYFKDKEGKYLNLENGSRVKLKEVEVGAWSMTLTFRYEGREVEIYFNGLYGNELAMVIPSGLHLTTVVKFGTLSGVGNMLEKVLTNWTEQEEVILGLDWED